MGISVATLTKLKSLLEQSTNVTDTSALVAHIDRLLAKAKPQRIVVDVVGSTGGGKSSVINAVFDE